MIMDSPTTSSTTQFRFQYNLEEIDRSACNKYFKCKDLATALLQFEAGCDHKGIKPRNVISFKWEPKTGWVVIPD